MNPAIAAAVGRQILTHPLGELLHRDPFTRRGFDKPRGYAGDAVLIDYLYATAPPGQLEPAIGHIHRYITGRLDCGRSR